jgi:hypothetical protein
MSQVSSHISTAGTRSLSLGQKVMFHKSMDDFSILLVVIDQSLIQDHPVPEFLPAIIGHAERGTAIERLTFRT